MRNGMPGLLVVCVFAMGALADERTGVSLVPAGAVVQKVAGNFKFTEGPCWDYKSGLYFSDIPANQIIKVADGGHAVWRDNSGGANGLIFDGQRRLVVCEGAARRVTRYTEVTGKWEVLADGYNGRKLNQPNDVVIDTQGRLYFTDPYYGSTPGILEQDRQAVYRIDQDGKVTRIIDDTKKCNGIAISPDGGTLYIVDNGAGTLLAYPLNADGTVGGGRVIAQAPQGDGMCVDEKGNLYVTCRDGVRVFSRDGSLLETIAVPEQPANCKFGDADLCTLYITARTGLYKIRLNARGWQVQRDGLKKQEAP